MSQVSSTKRLLSASAIMASGTLVSRILGMVRVALLAFIFANGTRQADIYSIATMVPNALYILFAGGALNTVLVPQIVRAIKHDEDGGEAFTNRIMTAFLMIIGAVAIIMTLCAPLITRLYSDSAWRAPGLTEQYASMVALTYLTLPQIFFYGLFFLLAQILNARDKFGPMMWAPIANNVISICVLGLYLIVWGNGGDKSAAFTTNQILVLGIGATLGIAAQSLVLLPFLKRIGFKLRPRFDLKGTGLGHTFSLTKWTLGFVGVNQLALIVVNRLATSATAGGSGAGATVYSNAHLLWILPHSLVTTSLATAMLSSASRLAADGNRDGVAAEMTKTARLALIFLVPATAAFLALALPIASLLFGHGRGTADSSWVGWTLAMFAVGLIPFTVQFVCLRTYYALEDTRTPFLLQIGIASANALGAVAFVTLVDDPAKVAPALALSYSVAYFLGVFASWAMLRRRLPALHGPTLGMHILRLTLGALPGAVGAWFLAEWIRGSLDHSLFGDILGVAAGGVLILGTTVVVGKLLKIREMRRLSELVRRRRGAKPAAKQGAAATPTTAPVADDDAPTRELPAVDDRTDAVEHHRPDPVAASAGAAAAVAVDSEDEADDPFDAPIDEPADDFDDDPPTVVRPRPADPGRFHDEDALADDEDTDETALDEDDDMEATQVVDLDPSLGEEGLVLGVRYQLVRRAGSRAHAETWLAHDQVLSRDVVAHLMAADDPHAERLLGAARRGAAATDSRFLRVLDVDEVHDDSPVGVYVICEHAAGRTVGELVEREPMASKEGAYIVREAADALTSMHAQGLFHEHLDPEHILVTRGGAVRIVGFGTASALEGGNPERAWSQREADDVRALAAILRATQTGHWSPDEEPAAPGYALSPVWADVFAGRISTVQGLVEALPRGDASGALEAKMALAGKARSTARPEPRPEPRTLVEDAVVLDAPEDGEELDPITQARPVRPRFVLWTLVILAILALVIGLVVNAVRGSESGDEAAPGPSASVSASPEAGAALEVRRVVDFDPEADGGNGEEFPDTAANVVDGDESTTWTTMRYLRRPNMGGLKPGVGLALDLGETRTVSSVDVTFVGDGATTVELRVPAGDDASMRSVQDWEVVAPKSEAPVGTQTITPGSPVETRWVLVYVSNLPPVEGGFAAEIVEIVVHGE